MNDDDLDITVGRPVKPGTPEADELIAGRQLAKVDFEDGNYDSSGEDLFVRSVDEANLITSLDAAPAPLAPAGGYHLPVIDLDMPARVVPSSTPGHHHLYIDKRVSWGQYVKLLEALQDAGLVEPGYVASSRKRGYTAVRPPWVRKERS